MKDTIKNSIVGGLAIFGLVSLISSSVSSTHEGSNTPESHVWDMKIQNGDNGLAFSINKVTGEVRKYAKTYPTCCYDSYLTMKPHEKFK